MKKTILILMVLFQVLFSSELKAEQEVVYENVNNNSSISKKEKKIIEAFESGAEIYCKTNHSRGIISISSWKLKGVRFVRNKMFYNLRECSR